MKRRKGKVYVSEKNLQTAAARILPRRGSLVSVEVGYLRRHLGEYATQEEIDEAIAAVRKLPWSKLLQE